MRLYTELNKGIHFVGVISTFFILISNENNKSEFFELVEHIGQLQKINRKHYYTYIETGTNLFFSALRRKKVLPHFFVVKQKRRL